MVNLNEIKKQRAVASTMTTVLVMQLRNLADNQTSEESKLIIDTSAKVIEKQNEMLNGVFEKLVETVPG